jgi:hypothetical protein
LNSIRVDATREPSRNTSRRNSKRLADALPQIVDAQSMVPSLPKRCSRCAGASSMWRAPIAAITARPPIASRPGTDHPRRAARLKL